MKGRVVTYLGECYFKCFKNCIFFSDANLFKSKFEEAKTILLTECHLYNGECDLTSEDEEEENCDDEKKNNSDKIELTKIPEKLTEDISKLSVNS